MPLPDAIQNAPSLYPGLELYYEAFSELSTCRTFGMGGAGPIPWTAISRYGDELGLGWEERLYMTHLIREMDAVWLEHMEEQNGQS